MKTIKVLFTIMLVSFIPMFLTSCDNDVEQKSDTLVGKWENIRYIGGVAISENFVFTSNKKYTYNIGTSEIDKGTYTLSDNGTKVLLVSEDYYVADTELLVKGDYLLDPDTGNKYYKVK